MMLIVSLLWFTGLVAWSLYEKSIWDNRNSKIIPNLENKIVMGSDINKCCCDPCKKPKKQKAKVKVKPKPKPKPVTTAEVKLPKVGDECEAGGNKGKVEVEVLSDGSQKLRCVWEAKKPQQPTLVAKMVEPKAILSSVDPTFGKTEVEFTPLPEKEVEPPRVGRKIIVVRQQPAMPYYGGYGYGYSNSYYAPPQVIYGGTPTFIPNPPVIVQAPSVVTPPPSVVVPAGGVPQGTTGGRSPSGVTGNAF
ncbi:MAG TPA: hypothetical protein DCS23_01440 [Candidatus Yonathbacteria bacterium]|nr:hypothetical protein [Candidatus Yonathbacteria bacterium]